MGKMKKRIRPKHRNKARTPITRKVFRDPIHDLIVLAPDDSFALDLIGTKEFQRLRRIRQLGLASLVYPGAEHSRFVHSMGVFSFSCRMLRRLLMRYANKREVRRELEKYARTIKAAALLHDLGHGPFSHVYERVFDDGRSHEQWTCEIVRDKYTEVHEALIECGIDHGAVCSLVWDNAHKEYEGITRPEPYIKDIVSSQLDADRMDYLLRDSTMTGSRYGQYDSEWILNALAIGDIRHGERRIKKLCLDQSKGTGAIEGFLFARMLMTQHVYGHKTIRAFESELLQTFRLAARCIDDLPADTPQPILTLLKKKGRVSMKEYLLLDDEVSWWALRRWAAWKPPKIRRYESFADALSRHSLRLVRRLEPWKTVTLTAKKYISAKRLVDRLRSDDNPLQYECHADDSKLLPYKNLMTSISKGGDDEQAFFDGIYLVGKDEETERIDVEPMGPIIRAFCEQTVTCRLFYDRRYQKDFTRLLKEYDVC